MTNNVPKLATRQRGGEVPTLGRGRGGGERGLFLPLRAPGLEATPAIPGYRRAWTVDDQSTRSTRRVHGPLSFTLRVFIFLARAPARAQFN